MLRRLALTTLCLLFLACTASEDAAPRDLFMSLKSARNGQVDADTQRAIRLLLSVLDARDWGYLTYARWPRDGGQAALRDPTLRKAMLALAQTSTVGVQALAAQPSPGGTPPTHYDESVWTERYTDAIEILTRDAGSDFAQTPGVATAWADLLTGALRNETGSILPDPTASADGAISGCGIDFYESDNAKKSLCSGIDFCCRGVINVNDGTTFCDDLESCRGTGRAPFLSDDKGDTSNDDLCSLAGISGAARVPACDCAIGVATYSFTFPEAASTTGGHWCCASYSTGPDCPGDIDKAACFYVDRAPDGNGCCATVPEGPPEGCSDFDDPTVQPDLNGAPVCCAKL